MVGVFAGPAAAFVTLFGLAALGMLCIAVYWLFNKHVRLRELARVRELLARYNPSDPEYNTVRALYTSMVIDAERWSFFHSDSASMDHGGDGHHVSSDAAGGGNHH
ncbi:hypothetical protein LQG66_06335 [Bradyrhizobium ontarionense]|uniref:Uncharacterized protein n=1 Tax=Bradyrhizobium ontarionense TaxID=2898149 RepID=A0ABY3RF32_9BRAD|nr:hypothetical protein [Bradyrhizobium sp. A19]UFZ05923.1 hypothetical protein LQG66_06335 [Bradyrhizobium sp. A19]